MSFTQLRTLDHAVRAVEAARVARFTAGYDAGRNNKLVVLSADPDWLDGFITGRADYHNR